MRNLVAKLVTGKEKAIVAFLVATIGSFVAKHGVTLDMTLGQALQALIVGLVAHVSVFLTANRG